MDATIGQAMLELLADGKTMLRREMASCLGVPSEVIRKSCATLVSRGFILDMEGCCQITDKGKAFLASMKNCSNGPQKGDFTARSRFSLRTRAWNLIRMKTASWSVDDLLMTLADGTEKDAERGLKRYVRALLKAGYVERTPRNPQLFRLVKNTGRLAPALNTPAKTLTDPNTGEAHHV